MTTTEVVRGPRRSGRTTDALKWLADDAPGRALYVTNTSHRARVIRQIAAPNVIVFPLREIATRGLDKLRGCHFARVALDDRDFYMPRDWVLAAEAIEMCLAPGARVREIREEHGP